MWIGAVKDFLEFLEVVWEVHSEVGVLVEC